MTDVKDLTIKGEIEIIEKTKTIFKENNEIIVSNALEILLNSLNTQQNIGIDKLRIYGLNGTKDINILEANYISFENAIQFKAMVNESDYNGYINKMELVSTYNDKVFARKQSLNIFKDDAHKLQVLWKISLNLTT